jgi:MerR HTH family regulatory protein
MHTETKVNDLARFYTVAETARCLGLPEARVRDWQLKKFITPALSKGRLQFSRADVTRAFVLGQLQDVFGATAFVTGVAKALTVDALDAILDAATRPQAVAAVGGRTFKVDLDPIAVADLRARMAEVPR